mgnify:FL=1
MLTRRPLTPSEVRPNVDPVLLDRLDEGIRVAFKVGYAVGIVDSLFDWEVVLVSDRETVLSDAEEV